VLLPAVPDLVVFLDIMKEIPQNPQRQETAQ
jgi:hypothetical protein